MQSEGAIQTLIYFLPELYRKQLTDVTRSATHLWSFRTRLPRHLVISYYWWRWDILGDSLLSVIKAIDAFFPVTNLVNVSTDLEFLWSNQPLDSFLRGIIANEPINCFLVCFFHSYAISSTGRFMVGNSKRQSLKFLIKWCFNYF